MFTSIIAIATAMVGSSAAVPVLSYLASWMLGQGFTTLMGKPFVQKWLGLLMQSAKAVGVTLDALLNKGLFQYLIGPFLCVLILVIFWLMTLMDKMLESASPNIKRLVTNLQGAMQKIGSTDRALYLQTKTMPAEQVKAVTDMARAVAAGPDKVPAEALTALRMAQEAGRALQEARLTAEG